MPIGLQTLSTLLLPDMKSWWNLPSFWWRSPLQTKLLKCTKYWPCPWHAPIWSSFLDTFWDSCSGKFPKIILSKPHYFPSSAHFKLCNSWTILATACYRPALQPRQTCPAAQANLPAPLTLLRRGLLNHSPCTALDGNNACTEVFDSDYRGENQGSDVGTSAAAISPLQAHAMGSSW